MTGSIPPLPPRRSKSAPTGFARLMKIVLLFILALLLAAVAYAGYIYYKLDKMIDDVSDGGGGGISDRTDAPGTDEKPSVKDNATAFLLLGLDTRPATGSINTDVMIVAVLNPDRKTGAVVSIPRDTLIETGGHSGKANSFYAHYYRQDRNTAPREVKTAISKYLDIPIDYVGLIDFKGFEEVVNSLGGISVHVDINMCYQDPTDGTDINLRSGQQNLTGAKALDYVRYRNSNCEPQTQESNDMQRNARQQQVISAIVSKLKTPSILVKLPELIDVVGRNVKTDIPSDQLRQLISTYLGIDSGSIEYYHLEGDWRSPYLYIDNKDLETARALLKSQME